MEIKEKIDGKWHEIKGKIKEKWAEFTNDDIKKLEGKMENLSGILQQRYGYTKEKSDKEAEKFLHDLNTEK